MAHEHKEVLIALAEGKEIQFKSYHLDIWTTAKSDGVNPIRDTNLEWRIKPDFIEECYATWWRSDKTCNDKQEIYTAGFIRGALANQNGEHY